MEYFLVKIIYFSLRIDILLRYDREIFFLHYIRNLGVAQ